MKKLVIFAGVGLLGLVIVGVMAWYLVSPLFIDDVVDEGFPLAAASSQDEAASLAQVSQTSLDQIEAEIGDQLSFELPSADQLADMPEEDLAQMEAEIMDASADMPDKTTADPMPAEVADGPVAVMQGQLQGADSFHQGSGLATIYQLPDGSHILRFEDFMVTNGPDLHVILTKHPAPTTRADIMEDYIDLGQLKGNIGNQNYDIPADVDVAQYQSIVVYCMPFHVVFSTATLG